MSLEKVRDCLRAAGMADRIVEFEASSATVELAAAAIGCAPERIAKSLAFLIGGTATLVVTSGDRKVDNVKFKAEFNTKATMLTPTQTEELVGHAVGGVCPFALNPGVTVCLDSSLLRLETVYPACGSSHSVICLTPAELERLASPVRWVDVCKPVAAPV